MYSLPVYGELQVFYSREKNFGGPRVWEEDYFRQSVSQSVKRPLRRIEKKRAFRVVGRAEGRFFSGLKILSNLAVITTLHRDLSSGFEASGLDVRRGWPLPSCLKQRVQHNRTLSASTIIRDNGNSNPAWQQPPASQVAQQPAA